MLPWGSQRIRQDCIIMLLRSLPFLGAVLSRFADTPTPLASCLDHALGGEKGLVAWPDDWFFQKNDVGRWNLDIKVEPAVVTSPKTADQVAAMIRCAASHQFKVQAKCGGHSYGNFGKYTPNVLVCGRRY